MTHIRGGIGAVALVSAVALAPPAVAQGVPLAQASPAPVVAVPAPDAPRPRRHHAKGDPLEGFNRAMYAVFKVLDRFLYRPVAVAYKTVVPKPLRTGIRHVFSNASEPIVFLNDVLQLKPKRAVKTFGRFMINSTIGVGGVFEMAKPEFHLPHHDNGFGNTLGRYGVHPGPYLFLPFVGPSNFRDFLGDGTDGLVLPYTIGTPFDRVEFQVTRSVITGLDQRAESDDELRALESGAVDPYATLRSSYLQNRAATIAEIRGIGEAAPDALNDPLADPAGTGGVATPLPPSADDPLVDPAAPALAPAPVPSGAPVPSPTPTATPAPSH